jgi:hypothetical protein
VNQKINSGGGTGTTTGNVFGANWALAGYF